MPGASIVSRDWNDVAEGKPPTLTPLGTSPQGQVLHEPLRGWASFSATFRVMFKEEGRKSIEFAKKTADCPVSAVAHPGHSVNHNWAAIPCGRLFGSGQ